MINESPNVVTVLSFVDDRPTAPLGWVSNDEAPKILYQNDLSFTLYGDFISGSALLNGLFSLEPASYESMMDELRRGKTWKRVVAVSNSLAVQEAEAEVERFHRMPSALPTRLPPDDESLQCQGVAVG